ncbi:MAG: glutaminyl-peptide cyclotransferase [Acidobacteriota bacterium]
MRRVGLKVFCILALVAALGLLLMTHGALQDSPGTRTTLRDTPAPLENLSGLGWDGEALWMTVDGGGGIHRVDPHSWEVLHRFDFAIEKTGGITWDGTHLWQLAYEVQKIFRLDPESGEILEEFPTPGEGMCAGLTYDGESLWASNFSDKKFYRLDPDDGGRVIESIGGYFEATGLAWDGEYLWNGLLVGTESFGQDPPYTGFVQQRDTETGETLSVYHVPGVGAGAAAWVPGQAEAASRYWWYDYFHNRIVEVRRERDPLLGLRTWAALAFLLAAVAAVAALRV